MSRSEARPLVALGLLLGLAACPLGPGDLPEDLQLPCRSNDECPPAWVCREGLGRCLPAAGLDEVAPTFREPPTASPERLSRQPGHDQLTVRFSVDEDLGVAAPGVVVTVGLHAMSCAREVGDVVEYTCSYAVGEDDDEGRQQVVVALQDASGNKAREQTEVVFDFQGPEVASAQVAYTPRPDSPLAVIRRASVGADITVTMGADEPLGEEATLTASNGAFELVFARVGATSSSVTFRATVPAGASDGVYAPSLRWQDLVGNESGGASFTEPLLEVQASLPTLVVDQGAVSYLRSPSGNDSEEVLDDGVTSFSLPAGPYFALAPSDPLSAADRLPATTFTLEGGAAPTRLSIWADASRETLVGTASPNADGSWPRQRLANLDAPAVYVSGIDDAGNDSALVRLEEAVWIATPRPPAFGASPHRFEAISVVDDGFAQAPGVTRPAGPGAEGTGGDAARVLAEAAWRQLAAPSGPLARRLHGMAYDSARELGVLFGGSTSLGRSDETWEWDGSAWSERVPVGPRPPARDRHALVYDAARGRSVLYGGAGAEGPLDDTWEWDGHTWTQRAPAEPTPGPRRDHAMAYDAARGVVVLFGGLFREDTWEWDGTSWRDVTPPSGGPPARIEHAMAYDAARGVVVLFGGRVDLASGELAADLWEWDGVAWTERTPAGAAPSGKNSHVLAYDSAREVTVLYGGNFNDPSREVWEWDGVAWTERTPSLAAPQPEGRVDSAMIYDAARAELLLFSGNSRPDDVWGWDGVAWAERTPSFAIPPARAEHAMVFDRDRGVVVLFGGDGGDELLRDTWEFDGRTWSERTFASRPSARRKHAMVYDDQGGLTVLFGGEDAIGAPLNDLWVYDGASWTQRQSNDQARAPFQRREHALAYDSARQRVVLFGGRDRFGNLFDDVWEWDNASWTERTPASGPSARARHGLAFDAAAGATLLFGGIDDVADTPNDLWQWDGQSWTQLTTPSTEPPHGRMSPAWFYDVDRGRVVMFAGATGGAERDVWEWDGASWSERTPRTSPSPRVGHTLVYDEARGRALLFGGRALDGVPPFDDVWEWRADEARRPALQLTVFPTLAGIPRDAVTGFGVRARAGARFAPFGAGDVGAALFAWRGPDPSGTASGWSRLTSNGAGIEVPLPESELSFFAADEAEARGFYVGGEDAFAVQLRPDDDTPGGVSAEEPEVAVDYVELRVRYRLP